MNAFLQLLSAIPTSIQVFIASAAIGGVGVYAHESRYMTVGDYTKSYVLDLKREIRSIQYELQNPDLDQQIRHMLEEQLQDMLDELCYERPDDPYCA